MASNCEMFILTVRHPNPLILWYVFRCWMEQAKILGFQILFFRSQENVSPIAVDNRWYFHFIIEQLPNPALMCSQSNHITYVIHLILFVSVFGFGAFTKPHGTRMMAFCTDFLRFFPFFLKCAVCYLIFVLQHFTFLRVFFFSRCVEWRLLDFL